MASAGPAWNRSAGISPAAGETAAEAARLRACRVGAGAAVASGAATAVRRAPANMRDDEADAAE
jgi:hypothetical protein